MFDHLWRVVLRLVLFFIVCLPVQIKASIISADDSTFGAGTLTRDTLQGLDFLDVTFSVGLTRAYVSSQFVTGGQFAGFRYATDDEVINLINNTGFNPVAVSGADVAGTNGIDYLSSLVSLLDPILSNTFNDAVFGQAVCSLAPGACRISIYDRHVQGSDLGKCNRRIRFQSGRDELWFLFSQINSGPRASYFLVACRWNSLALGIP